MNNINDVYKEFGNNFCLCPFLGAFYQTNKIKNTHQPNEDQESVNDIRPCSLVDYPQGPSQWNVLDGNLSQSRNNQHWIRLRKAFANGEYETIPECRLCWSAEKQGAKPGRIGSNLHFAHHCTSDIMNEVQQIIANDFVASKLKSLDYFPSNYCNYACIMCSPGASTGRMTFEVSVLNRPFKTTLNHYDKDFLALLHEIEVLNFTGGETLMQPEVHEVIDYLINNDLASNITIYLLTNASEYPEKFIPKFRKFRKVVFMCSIDGIDDVIEYQRRGAKWSTVAEVSKRISHHEFIESVVNFTLTAVNALNLPRFISWLDQNKINGVCVTPVFREDYMSVDAVPPELMQPLLEQLEQDLIQYKNIADAWTQKNTVELVETVIGILKNSVHQPDYLRRLKYKTMNEDRASSKPFLEVVPEWQPYFDACKPPWLK